MHRRPFSAAQGLFQRGHPGVQSSGDTGYPLDAADVPPVIRSHCVASRAPVDSAATSSACQPPCGGSQHVILQPLRTGCIDALAADAPAALAAIAAARATARAGAWSLAGTNAPDHAADAASPLVIDVDATLVGAHSEKESAAPTFKRGFGFHPLWAFCDHGTEGTGEPQALLLRPGNAGSNTATDHITVLQQALAQLPGGHARGKKVLVRVDGAGGTHELLAWLTRRRLSYWIGFSCPAT